VSAAVAVSAAEMIVGGDAPPLPATLARALRRADDLTILAITTAHAALQRAPQRPVAPEARGLFVGMVHGPIETSFRYLDSLVDDGEGQSSPTLFSHSVHNAVAGYVARLFDCQGPSLTVTTFTWPFLIALDEARRAIAAGHAERALAIAVETSCPVLEEARRRIAAGHGEPWLPAAVAWVLDAADEGNAPGPILTEVEVSEAPCHPQALLTRSGETRSGPFLDSTDQQPLGVAIALTRALARAGEVPPGALRWGLASPGAEATLAIDTRAGRREDR